MENQNGDTGKKSLDDLLSKVDSDYQKLLDVQSLSMDYLSKDGVTAKKAYRVIWDSLIFADTKEDAKANLEEVIRKKDSPACFEMTEDILKMLKQFVRHNFT